MQPSTFSDAQIQTLVDQINTCGFAVLPAWASDGELGQLQDFVASAVTAAGNQYVALTGADAVAGSALHQWGQSAAFLDLCKRVAAKGAGMDSQESSVHQVLRCLIGERGQRESLIFHYDSYVLTAIMPVCMPEGEKSGDLLMLPSHRPVRRSYARNLLDKMLVDNQWSQRRLANRHAKHPEAFTRVHMTAGNMYLFWGYRSLHTNLPADPDAIRATAVFHYQNVHASSSLAAFIRQSLERLRPRRHHQPEPLTEQL